ncbi:hypothetical protein KDW10_30545 [Burkholderia vietnamiensis]|uniref:hypothetical protein n=1 Tax=Burkholderia vietnamiensis TaxID=60552 RepID=UPI001B8FE499|nr:hypothetical protein [Burkholderia vietnamiensis]MBR8361671.1 hypothetical protein [Burkholderia vietnamiensis]
MSNLDALHKAACDATEKFIAARDELVKAETAYNAALKTAAPEERNAAGRARPMHAAGHGRPLNFSNTVFTDC